MSELESRDGLIKRAMTGIACIIGGIIILTMGGFGFVGGLILGGIISIIGLAIIASKKDGFVGLLVLCAGVLILITKIPLLGALATLFIIISGWALIVIGVVSLILFIASMMKRM